MSVEVQPILNAPEFRDIQPRQPEIRDLSDEMLIRKIDTAHRIMDIAAEGLDDPDGSLPESVAKLVEEYDTTDEQYMRLIEEADRRSLLSESAPDKEDMTPLFN